MIISFGSAYFTGYVIEPDEHAAISVAAGFGFHSVAEIAAVRALTEAVQGRLSHIHGGRDDIIKRVEGGAQLGRELELDYIRRLRLMASNPRAEMAFSEVPNVDVRSLVEACECMFEGLSCAGLLHVVRVVLTPPDYPFQVVKMIIPGAEMYEHETKRLGPSLLGHFQNQELQHA